MILFDDECSNPDLFIVELAPQQLVLCRVCAELDLSLDHFRQMQHPIQSFLCDHGASSHCTKTESRERLRERSSL